MRAAQILRLAIIAVVALAFLGRGAWPELYLWVRQYLIVLVLVYAGVTLYIRTLERRVRRRRALEAASGPWTCDVCENVNGPGAGRCERCTVPRPGGA